MWNGKKKAVTFSYDDGVEQDRRLIALFNKYGMKATFNQNSGIQTRADTFTQGDIVVHITRPAGSRKRATVREYPALPKTTAAALSSRRP